MSYSRQRFERSLRVAQAGLVWADLDELQISEFIRCGSCESGQSVLPYSAEAMEQLAKSGRFNAGGKT